MKAPKITILAAAAAIFSSAIFAFAQGQGTGQQNQGGTGQQNQNQNQNSPQVTSQEIPRKFWEVRLSDGGAYMVALGRITSIAKHEYIVDGTVRVFELTVTSEGSTITRFYHLEAVSDKSPSNVGQVVIDRVKSTTEKLATRTNTRDQFEKVSKSYPHGTHSGNIEYRLSKKANVDQLYASVHNAWYNNKGTRVTVSSKKK